MHNTLPSSASAPSVGENPPIVSTVDARQIESLRELADIIVACFMLERADLNGSQNAGETKPVKPESKELTGSNPRGQSDIGRL